MAKTKVPLANVKSEAWALIRAHRRSLGIGLGLMVIGRLASFVLPLSTKFLFDDVITLGWPCSCARRLYFSLKMS